MKYVFEYVDDMNNYYKLEKDFSDYSSVMLLDEKPTEYDALLDEFINFLKIIGFDDNIISSRIEICEECEE